jgi:hypothetical protein
VLRATNSPWYRYVLDQPRHERIVAAARDALGAQEFERTWARGRALSLEQAIAEALAVAGEN